MLMPAQRVLPAVLLTFAVIGLDIANRTLNAKDPAVGSLTLEEFNKLHKEVRPPKDEVWRTIPWKLSLLEAQRLAATEQKPIFLWAMAGNPLACVWNNGIIDRASTFNDPEIVQLLRTRFIAAAIDRDVPDRGEQDFFRKIGAQSERDTTGKPLQGMYVATPDGKLLAGGYNCVETLPQFRALLKKALGDYKPAKVAVIEPSRASPFVKPPEGGLVVNVYAKVLGSYKEADYKESPTYVLQYLKAYQSSIGRDHLWVWKEEHEALARGIVPDSLKRRIARCHLDDSTVGSFPGWKRQEVKKVELTLRDGRLTGSVLVETADRKRGYDAEVLGFVETREGKVTRFDMVVKGQFWGDTAETRGAPNGRHPLAIAFSLVTGLEETDKIPPAMIFEEGYKR